MKAWEVIGHAADAETCCPACAEARYGPAHPGGDRRDREGNRVHPVLAGGEWTYEPACGAPPPARVGDGGRMKA